MRIILSSILISFIFFLGCEKGNKTEMEEIDATESTTTDMEDLVVPDGFNYETTTKVLFDLTMLDSSGAPAVHVLTKIIGVSDIEIPGGLYSGLSDENGELQIEVNVPIHFKNLVVNTSFQGTITSFEFDLAPTISEEITVAGGNLLGVDDRSLNCYPTVVSSFSSNNKLISVSSTKSVTSIQLYYSGGTNQTYANTGNQIFYTASPEICNDGIDNDGDGLIDCADPECATNQSLCNGNIPCVEGFFQIVGKDLKQLDPVTGAYTTIGTLPNSFSKYNGGGYNKEDGYMYCIGKINSTGKHYLVRIYSNANITNMGELTNFEGLDYTGDMDKNGNWTNFYRTASNTWKMATVDVSVSPPVFVTQSATSDAGSSGASFHDWVYNKTCNKFYTLTKGTFKLLSANITTSPPTISHVTTFSGLPSGAFGAAWSDVNGDLFFSENTTGKIYKVDMGGNCTPGTITHVFTGSATGNNDGMSCPDATAVTFGGTDSDGDGITDSAELDAFTNPNDACNPLPNSPACTGSLGYGFAGGSNSGLAISYAKCTFGCDAPIEYTYVYNSSVDNDLDNDLVPNATDPDPLNANKTFVQYRPSQNTFGTYGFEDLWPDKGDYDYNDFVVQVRENIVTNSSNLIYEVKYELRIMAMGGIYNNNFAISLPDPNNTAVVTVTSLHNVTHTTEQRGNNEVITILKPKQLFFTTDIVNAINTDTYYTPIEIQVKVEFNGDYAYPGGYTPIYFIEQNGINGHEIHMPGVAPTSNMITSLLGTHDDESDPNTGVYYLDNKNLPWALYVPTEWNYPIESSKLTKAYLKFQEFAQTTPTLSWYQNNAGYIVTSKTYTQH